MGIARLHLPDRVGDQRRRGGGKNADADVLGRLLARAQQLEAVAQRADGLGRVAQQDMARRSELQPLAVPQRQGFAGNGLQFGQALGDGGRRLGQGVGGLQHAAMAGQGNQTLQVPQAQARVEDAQHDFLFLN